MKVTPRGDQSNPKAARKVTPMIDQNNPKHPVTPESSGYFDQPFMQIYKQGLFLC